MYRYLLQLNIKPNIFALKISFKNVCTVLIFLISTGGSRNNAGGLHNNKSTVPARRISHCDTLRSPQDNINYENQPRAYPSI